MPHSHVQSNLTECTTVKVSTSVTEDIPYTQKKNFNVSFFSGSLLVTADKYIAGIYLLIVVRVCSMAKNGKWLCID